METKYRSSNIAKSSKRFTSIRKAKKAFKIYKGFSKGQNVSVLFNVDYIIENQYIGSYNSIPLKLTFRVYFSTFKPKPKWHFSQKRKILP